MNVILDVNGADSRVAKAMAAGQYNFAVTFQERIKISEENISFYKKWQTCMSETMFPLTSTAGFSLSINMSGLVLEQLLTVLRLSSIRKPCVSALVIILSMEK